MLSYTDILRISFADISDDENNIDTFVYDMFTIKQVMAKNVTVVDPDATIKEVSKLLAAKQFHALPVAKNGKLVGIITSTDLINFLVQQL